MALSTEHLKVGSSAIFSMALFSWTKSSTPCGVPTQANAWKVPSDKKRNTTAKYLIFKSGFNHENFNFSLLDVPIFYFELFLYSYILSILVHKSKKGLAFPIVPLAVAS